MSLDKIIDEMREYRIRKSLDWADRLAALPKGEPVGWVYQHEETGRMSFCENDGINTPEVFGPLNPRLTLCGPAFTAQPAPVITDEVREAVMQGVKAMERCQREGSGNTWKPYINRVRAFLRDAGL